MYAKYGIHMEVGMDAWCRAYEQTPKYTRTTFTEAL